MSQSRDARESVRATAAEFAVAFDVELVSIP